MHQHEASHEHGHGGSHGHSHAPAPDTSGRILLATMAINLLIPLCQILGGIVAQSMAVISDALHNFSDFTGLLIAYGAYLIAKKPPSFRFSFGFRRAEILSALLNVTLLMGASLFILFEAIDRIRHPEPIVAPLVIILAGVGIAGNGVSAYLLFRESAHSLNIRGAFIHMVGDLVTSLAVLLSGIVISFWPLYWIDPLLSMLIVVFIARSSWSVLRDSGRILMEATPPEIRLDDIHSALMAYPEVYHVHDLHVWSVGFQSVFLTCHLVVDDQKLSEKQELASRIREDIGGRFGISHMVLEFEHTSCGRDDLLCFLEQHGA
jgi:cation diffusion facilitator family transporter